jgi:hypothetical protein
VTDAQVSDRSATEASERATHEFEQALARLIALLGAAAEDLGRSESLGGHGGSNMSSPEDGAGATDR